MTWPPLQPIETAPKSTAQAVTHADGTRGVLVRAVYLLGYCPDESVIDPMGCFEVIWWEPCLDGGRWQSSADVPIRPTHWTTLPVPPTHG